MRTNVRVVVEKPRLLELADHVREFGECLRECLRIPPRRVVSERQQGVAQKRWIGKIENQVEMGPLATEFLQQIDSTLRRRRADNHGVLAQMPAHLHDLLAYDRNAFRKLNRARALSGFFDCDGAMQVRRKLFDDLSSCGGGTDNDQRAGRAI